MAKNEISDLIGEVKAPRPKRVRPGGSRLDGYEASRRKAAAEPPDRRVNWLIPGRLHRALKTCALDEGKSMQRVAMEAMAEHLRDYLPDDGLEWLGGDADA